MDTDQNSLEQTLAALVRMAFSLPAVQRAFVECVNCGSPIGRELNNLISQACNDQMHDRPDRDDVDSMIRDAIGDHTVEADNVSGLTEAIEEVIEGNPVEADNISGLDDMITEAVVTALREVRVRLTVD